MSDHFHASPSSAKQWTECTASIPFIEQLRQEGKIPRHSVSSAYSLEGTEAHSWGEKVLRNQITLAQVPDAFRGPVSIYVKACEDLLRPNAYRGVELRVPLFYAPEGRGTIDWFVINTDPVEIHVRDLKYGEGVLVKSEFNKQLAIYAWSAILNVVDNEGTFDMFPLDTPVTIHAIQPRHREWVDEPWVTTIGELKEFCENEIAPYYQLIVDGDTEFSPTHDACFFCDAKRHCAARAKGLKVLPVDINPLETWEDLTKPDMTTLSDEVRLACFANRKLIESFLEDVSEGLLADALAGKPVPGTKLVAGRQGNRKWQDIGMTDAALAAAGLGLTERYDQSLKGVTDVEKILKAKSLDLDIAPLVVRSPAKTVLALEDDKRPAVQAAVDEWENLESPSSLPGEE